MNVLLKKRKDIVLEEYFKFYSKFYKHRQFSYFMYAKVEKKPTIPITLN